MHQILHSYLQLTLTYWGVTAELCYRFIMQFPFAKCLNFTVVMSTPLHVQSFPVIMKFLTQVHDELVLEVDPSMVKEAAALLQISMENAASLLGKYAASIFCLSLHSKCLPQELSLILFSSSASQIESWTILGFFGAIRARSLQEWSSCAGILTTKVFSYVTDFQIFGSRFVCYNHMIFIYSRKLHISSTIW